MVITLQLVSLLQYIMVPANEVINNNNMEGNMVKEYIKKSDIIEARESIEKAIELLNADDYETNDLNRIENLMVYAADLLTPINREDD